MARTPTPTTDPAPPPALPAPVRWLLMLLAVVSLALGVAGVFLPVLPTVPFVLLAAWAASYSSPRLSRWLERHPRFGLQIRQWRQAGVVSRRAKWTATVCMAASATGTLLLLRGRWPAFAAIFVMACVLAWLWRRPEHAPQSFDF